MIESIVINLPIAPHEVPDLRQFIGWDRRDRDYPAIFQRCTFWAGLRDKNGLLIAFSYITGMGLQHGYLEDVMVHPDYQKQGIGFALVTSLLQETERIGLEIVTVTYSPEKTHFYEKCGFSPCPGGLWRKKD